MRLRGEAPGRHLAGGDAGSATVITRGVCNFRDIRVTKYRRAYASILFILRRGESHSPILQTGKLRL